MTSICTLSLPKADEGSMSIHLGMDVQVGHADQRFDLSPSPNRGYDHSDEQDQYFESEEHDDFAWEVVGMPKQQARHGLQYDDIKQEQRHPRYYKIQSLVLTLYRPEIDLKHGGDGDCGDRGDCRTGQ
ncbi:hypothetical protein Forpi1262_v016259 [Fusarium oxysporum f. sp. raphani]|uniref:Uncharacterized protein n=1 Tax=Fusarium oxysporum f. sp. raphani TaxID=96318 RepID=A0A8J5PJM0_FUSOX|nr:hypothetical protein Forpi1262_v016259 [Fusarium oxysporum f. sp. raphani]